MRYACQTYFDITATGVTGHFKPSAMPFQDRAGQDILDHGSWNHSRNQQRNWETLTQLISMRANLSELLQPLGYKGTWTFEFEVETPDVFGPPENPVSVLLDDADGIPMINDLNNTRELVPFLKTQEPGQNIWFMPISINN
jgi:hypothetical protein